MNRDGFKRALFGAILFCAILSIGMTARAYGADQNIASAVDWIRLAAALAAGLAFFLYGISKMSAGLQNLAGDRMRAVLAALTKNRVAALIIGAFITVVINSSSATTSMLVGFVQAELLTFAQTLGVILGADIGTTLTVQLIAFRIDVYVIYGVIALGFFALLLGGDETAGNIGRTVMGFGLLFFGMMLMTEAMHPLRSYPGFARSLTNLDNRLLGVLAGAVITAVIQSSAATIGILMPLCASGLSLEAGIAVVMGANIGTCVTAGIACVEKTREAKRVVIAHVLFKAAGVAIFIFFIPQFAWLVKYLAACFGSGIGRQIANAHTIFNVAMALAFLPFTGVFIWLVYKIFPKRRIGGIRFDVWELDEALVAAPQFALGPAWKKLAGMGKLLEQMLRAVIIPFISDEKFIRREKLPAEEIGLLLKTVPRQDETYPELSLLEGIDRREKTIDTMEEKLKKFLLKVMRQPLSDEQARQADGIILIANKIEMVADIAHRNLMPLIGKKQKLQHDLSLRGKEEIMIFHHKSCELIRMLIKMILSQDPAKARQIAREIRNKMHECNRLKTEYFGQHFRRVFAGEEKSVETDEVHLELINILHDMNKYIGDIAKTVLDIWLAPARSEKKRGKK